MRGLRSTLALLVVLIGLGAYVYFVASKPQDPDGDQPKMFAGLEADQISELTVKAENGDVTNLTKTDGAWKMTAPIDTEASEMDASGIANALADIRVARVLEEAPTNLAEYGLETPHLEIDFKTSDGATSGSLFVGEKTATGGNLYARRDGQQRVVLIGQYHEASLNKSTFDLRDKTIVELDRSKVDGVDVTTNGNTVAMTKQDGEWSLTRPLSARADDSVAEGLVSKVESAAMKSIVTASPTADELERFGLDEPTATVNVHMGSALATLIVGGTADDGSVYVRDGSRPDVFTIDASGAADLDRPVEDYRRHDLFDFRVFNATHVEVIRDGKTLTLERVKSDSEGVADSWKRLSPTAADADREKVESFLAGLADIRATSFVASSARTGLDTPAMTVTAKFDEGRKEDRVTFGKSGDTVYATRPDSPDAATIDATKFDAAIKAFDELVK
jgi:hypothetical protein